MKKVIIALLIALYLVVAGYCEVRDYEVMQHTITSISESHQ